MRLLSLLVLLSVSSALLVSARLVAVDDSGAAFEVQGMELLAGRYGTAYPGFGASVVPQQQQNWALGLGEQNLNLGYAQQQLPMQQANVEWAMPQMQSNVASMLSSNLQLGASALPQSNYAQLAYGGVGSFGAGAAGMGSKKGTTTVAAPIYAQSMVVPKIITQPILRPHMITQPILQQQLIQQPIVETRQVIQPVIRRIITQPIIKPQIFESTTIQPTLKQETIVQPHLIEQTVVTPSMSNEFSENQPIQEAPVTQKQQAVVQPTVSGKQGQSALGMQYGGF